jgi:type II secretory pathway component GspD/PulD (secretin)
VNRMAIVIVTVLSLVAIGADAPAIKNLAARQATTKYDATVKKIEEESRRAKVAAAKELVAALEQAKKQAMQAGNLDEANSIQSAIEVAQGEQQARNVPVEGTRWKYNDGSILVFYGADGTVASSAWKSKGQWKSTGPRSLRQTDPAGPSVDVTFSESMEHSLWVYSDGKIAYAVRLR